ncbi:hypothetical protein BT96DRAFT_946132 [Gymnopus androsaceus JB14]|uniref:Uncharacterized protein n=1 Tax=Gymnopus androsaceus JB14 TaxID=1447944 RepID=A0A6A4GY95_9AGAR|nr:hypothetical protein BT96DRAFT_946132 [Gymnopus androsaceus JB14]
MLGVLPFTLPFWNTSDIRAVVGRRVTEAGKFGTLLAFGHAWLTLSRFIVTNQVLIDRLDRLARLSTSCPQVAKKSEINCGLSIDLLVWVEQAETSRNKPVNQYLFIDVGVLECHPRKVLFGSSSTRITYSWFKGACENVPSINGEKSAMIAHLIGSKRCPHASKKARKVAKQERDGKGSEMAASDGDDESSDSGVSRPKKRKKLTQVETHVQKTLKFPKGLNIPFTPEDVNLIKRQFICATISANLPFHWTSDAEVIKLFL